MNKTRATSAVCPVCLEELGERIQLPAGVTCPGCGSFTAAPAQTKRGPIRIGTSPLSNNIYAGRVRKDGKTWRDADKTDVTREAIGAVCEHAERFGAPITVNCNGKPKYRLTIDVLSSSDETK